VLHKKIFWITVFLVALAAGGLWFLERTPRPPEDGAIQAYLDQIHSVERQWNVSRVDGEYLHDFIVRHGLRRGVEVGTSNGYSAIWMGMALRRIGGRLITIEIDRNLVAQARRNVAHVGLAEVIEVRQGDALEVLRGLQGPFDFVFLDAQKLDYDLYFHLIYPQVAPGGYVLAHDVISHAQEMPEFLALVRDSPGLETVVDQAGGNGISVSRKRPGIEVPEPPLLHVVRKSAAWQRRGQSSVIRVEVEVRNVGRRPVFFEVLPEAEPLSFPASCLERLQADRTWRPVSSVASEAPALQRMQAAPGETLLGVVETVAPFPSEPANPARVPAYRSHRVRLRYFEDTQAGKRQDTQEQPVPPQWVESAPFLILER
jgi:caffeoyl-CoA O-methyltransferase